MNYINKVKKVRNNCGCKKKKIKKKKKKEKKKNNK